MRAGAGRRGWQHGRMLRVLTVLLCLTGSLPGMQAILDAAHDIDRRLRAGSMEWGAWGVCVRHSTRIDGEPIQVIQPLLNDPLPLWGDGDVHQVGSWLVIAEADHLRRAVALALGELALQRFTGSDAISAALRAHDLDRAPTTARIVATWHTREGERLRAFWRRSGTSDGPPTLVMGEWAFHFDADRATLERTVELLGGDAVQALFARDMRHLEHRLRNLMLAMIAYSTEHEQRWPALWLPDHPFPVIDAEAGALVTAATFEHLAHTLGPDRLPWTTFTSPFAPAPEPPEPARADLVIQRDPELAWGHAFCYDWSVPFDARSRRVVLATRHAITDPADDSQFLLAAYADGSIARIPVTAEAEADGTRGRDGTPLPWRASNPQIPADDILTATDDGAAQDEPNAGDALRSWVR